MKKTFIRIVIIILAVILLCAVILPSAVNAAETQTVLTVNAINSQYNGEGTALIITPKGRKVLDKGASGYCWYRTATFEWSDKEQAYIVRSVNSLWDGSTGKNNYIPENGFILVTNLGNDYTKLGGKVDYTNPIANSTFENISKLTPGDKAYLTGIDIDKGTIAVEGSPYYSKTLKSDAKIYINSRPNDAEVYTPDTSKPRLNDVELIDAPSAVTASEGITIKWRPVENAEYYIVNVNNSSLVTDGWIVADSQKVNGTEFTLSARVTAGNSYTISVAAYGTGYRSSYNIRHYVLVTSDRAKNSPYKDKTVVAFGDSITARPGWVSMLAGELGVTVLNAGVSGNTTNDAVKRIATDVVSKKPDIVLVLFGMNDQAVNGKNPLVGQRMYERNMRKIINTLHEAGSDIVLMTGNNVCTAANYYKTDGTLDYGTSNLSEYYGIIRKLASEYNLNLIDMNKIISDEKISDTTICAMGDGVHLSTKGQEYFTKWISDYLYESYESKEFVNDKDHQPQESSETSVENSIEISIEQSGEISIEQSVEPSVDIGTSEELSRPLTNNGRENNALSVILVISGVTVLAVALIFVFKKRSN